MYLKSKGVFIIPIKYLEYFKAQGIIEPEDIESCLSATDIESSIMTDEDTYHEEYYDSINDVIEALLQLAKFHPHLLNK